MALSLAQVVGDNYLWKIPLPLYIGFPLIALISTVITVAVSFSTAPTDKKTLKSFYASVQPAGAWNPVREELLTTQPGFRRETTFSREALNTVLSLIAIAALYVGTLYLILHRLNVAFGCFGTTLAMTVVLFFTWYKHLPPAEMATENETTPLSIPADAETVLTK